MTVYVDNARIPRGRYTMSHLMADTSGELMDMAWQLGLDVRWLQHPGRPDEHFDVAASKRELAIKLGAQPVESRTLVGLIQRKRESYDAGDHV